MRKTQPLCRYGNPCFIKTFRHIRPGNPLELDATQICWNVKEQCVRAVKGGAARFSDIVGDAANYLSQPGGCRPAFSADVIRCGAAIRFSTSDLKLKLNPSQQTLGIRNCPRKLSSNFSMLKALCLTPWSIKIHLLVLYWYMKHGSQFTFSSSSV